MITVIYILYMYIFYINWSGSYPAIMQTDHLRIEMPAEMEK